MFRKAVSTIEGYEGLVLSFLTYIDGLSLQCQSGLFILVPAASELIRGMHNATHELYLNSPMVSQSTPSFTITASSLTPHSGQRVYDQVRKVLHEADPPSKADSSFRLTNFPILLLISFYERQSKAAGAVKFSDTVSHLAERIYDTLPRPLKRMSMCLSLMMAGIQL